MVVSFADAGSPIEFYTTSTRLADGDGLHASVCGDADQVGSLTSLYVDGMVRIVVRPTWAKLIDFETTLPAAIQELMDRRTARQGA